MPVDMTKPFEWRPYKTERYVEHPPDAVFGRDGDERENYDDGAESNAVAALERARAEIVAERNAQKRSTEMRGLERAASIITRLLESKPK